MAMLKLIAYSLFLISFGTAAIPAQAPEAPHETDGLINGRSWSNLGENTKTSWLVGYTEGLRVAASLAQGEPCNSLHTTLLQPVGQSMQIRGEALESAHRLRITIRSYSRVMRTVAHIDSRGVRMDHLQSWVL